MTEEKIQDSSFFSRDTNNQEEKGTLLYSSPHKQAQNDNQNDSFRLIETEFSFEDQQKQCLSDGDVSGEKQRKERGEEILELNDPHSEKQTFQYQQSGGNNLQFNSGINCQKVNLSCYYSDTQNQLQHSHHIINEEQIENKEQPILNQKKNEQEEFILEILERRDDGGYYEYDENNRDNYQILNKNDIHLNELKYSSKQSVEIQNELFDNNDNHQHQPQEKMYDEQEENNHAANQLYSQHQSRFDEIGQTYHPLVEADDVNFGANNILGDISHGFDFGGQEHMEQAYIKQDNYLPVDHLSQNKQIVIEKSSLELLKERIIETSLVLGEKRELELKISSLENELVSVRRDAERAQERENKYKNELTFKNKELSLQKQKLVEYEGQFVNEQVQKKHQRVEKKTQQQLTIQNLQAELQEANKDIQRKTRALLDQALVIEKLKKTSQVKIQCSDAQVQTDKIEVSKILTSDQMTMCNLTSSFQDSNNKNHQTHQKESIELQESHSNSLCFDQVDDFENDNLHQMCVEVDSKDVQLPKDIDKYLEKETQINNACICSQKKNQESKGVQFIAEEMIEEEQTEKQNVSKLNSELLNISNKISQSETNVQNLIQDNAKKELQQYQQVGSTLQIISLNQQNNHNSVSQILDTKLKIFQEEIMKMQTVFFENLQAKIRTEDSQTYVKKEENSSDNKDQIFDVKQTKQIQDKQKEKEFIKQEQLSQSQQQKEQAQACIPQESTIELEQQKQSQLLKKQNHPKAFDTPLKKRGIVCKEEEQDDEYSINAVQHSGNKSIKKGRQAQKKNEKSKEKEDKKMAQQQQLTEQQQQLQSPQCTNLVSQSNIIKQENTPKEQKNEESSVVDKKEVIQNKPISTTILNNSSSLPDSQINQGDEGIKIKRKQRKIETVNQVTANSQIITNRNSSNIQALTQDQNINQTMNHSKQLKNIPLQFPQLPSQTQVDQKKHQLDFLLNNSTSNYQEGQDNDMADLNALLESKKRDILSRSEPVAYHPIPNSSLREGMNPSYLPLPGQIPISISAQNLSNSQKQNNEINNIQKTRTRQQSLRTQKEITPSYGYQEEQKQIALQQQFKEKEIQIQEYQESNDLLNQIGNTEDKQNKIETTQSTCLSESERRQRALLSLQQISNMNNPQNFNQSPKQQEIQQVFYQQEQQSIPQREQKQTNKKGYQLSSPVISVNQQQINQGFLNKCSQNGLKSVLYDSLINQPNYYQIFNNHYSILFSLDPHSKKVHQNIASQLNIETILLTTKYSQFSDCIDKNQAQNDYDTFIQYFLNRSYLQDIDKSYSYLFQSNNIHLKSHITHNLDPFNDKKRQKFLILFTLLTLHFHFAQLPNKLYELIEYAIKGGVNYDFIYIFINIHPYIFNQCQYVIPDSNICQDDCNNLPISAQKQQEKEETNNPKSDQDINKKQEQQQHNISKDELVKISQQTSYYTFSSQDITKYCCLTQTIRLIVIIVIYMNYKANEQKPQTYDCKLRLHWILSIIEASLRTNNSKSQADCILYQQLNINDISKRLQEPTLNYNKYSSFFAKQNKNSNSSSFQSDLITQFMHKYYIQLTEQQLYKWKNNSLNIHFDVLDFLGSFHLLVEFIKQTDVTIISNLFSNVLKGYFTNQKYSHTLQKTLQIINTSKLLKANQNQALSLEIRLILQKILEGNQKQSGIQYKEVDSLIVESLIF